MYTLILFPTQVQLFLELQLAWSGLDTCPHWTQLQLCPDLDWNNCISSWKDHPWAVTHIKWCYKNNFRQIRRSRHCNMNRTVSISSEKQQTGHVEWERTRSTLKYTSHISPSFWVVRGWVALTAWDVLLTFFFLSNNCNNSENSCCYSISLVSAKQLCDIVSLYLVTYLGKAYPVNLLSFNLAYGLFLYVVPGWQTKGFNPAFQHASLEDCMVQLAAKNLDCSP